jgi:hypothetical protein
MDLFRVAGIAAIVLELVLVLGLVTYFFWPYAPGNQSTDTIFRLLQSNPIGGLISLDLILVLGNLIGVVIFLSLYVSLRQVNNSLATLAFVIGLIGVVLLFPARPLVELLNLSHAYANETNEVIKSQYLATGDALMALFDGTGWFLNNLLGGLSLLVSSILMLRSELYSKGSAIVGIVSNAMVCLFFIPVIGMVFLFLSVPGYVIWYFLLARIFFKLGRGN